MILRSIRPAGAAGLVLIIAGWMSAEAGPPAREAPGEPGAVFSPSETEPSPGLAAEGVADPMLICNVRMEIQVAGVSNASSVALSLAEEIRGVVEQHQDNSPHSAYVKVSVPAESLPGFLEAMDALGNVTSRSVRKEDFRADYSRIQTRLQERLLQRDRLNRLLDRAADVEDVLAIEIQLSRAQRDVDAMAYQAGDLKRRVDYAGVVLILRLKEAEPGKASGPSVPRLPRPSRTGRRPFGVRDKVRPSRPPSPEPVLPPRHGFGAEDLSDLRYTVQEGDTMEAICRLFALPVEVIRQSNPALRDRDVIPGEKVFIPRTDGE